MIPHTLKLLCPTLPGRRRHPDRLRTVVPATHLSSEDLYRLVKQEDPTIGQTTVYRTLKLLTEAGLAREVRFGDGRTHYSTITSTSITIT